MQRSRARTIVVRVAAMLVTIISTVALAASPAHASDDSLAMSNSWGWASAGVTWPASSFEVSWSMAVNDNVADSWCVAAIVNRYDYNGHLSAGNYFYDCSGGNTPVTYSRSESFNPWTVYSVSLQLCKVRPWNSDLVNCSAQYAYR